MGCPGRRKLHLLAVLLAAAIAGCIVVEDNAMRPAGVTVEEHYRLDLGDQKVPVKDVRTEYTRNPDGTIVIKRDERHYEEGQKLLDKYLGEGSCGD